MLLHRQSCVKRLEIDPAVSVVRNAILLRMTDAQAALGGTGHISYGLGSTFFLLFLYIFFIFFVFGYSFLSFVLVNLTKVSLTQ